MASPFSQIKKSTCQGLWRRTYPVRCLAGFATTSLRTMSYIPVTMKGKSSSRTTAFLVAARHSQKCSKYRIFVLRGAGAFGSISASQRGMAWCGVDHGFCFSGLWAIRRASALVDSRVRSQVLPKNNVIEAVLVLQQEERTYESGMYERWGQQNVHYSTCFRGSPLAPSRCRRVSPSPSPIPSTVVYCSVKNETVVRSHFYRKYE